MTALLKAKAPATLQWKSATYSDEDHGSIRLKSIYDGLKFTYFGHSSSMIDFFPRDGIVLKGKPVQIMNYSTYLDQEPGIRYTTDGSDPTASSPKFEYGIQISAPASLTLKQFSNWGPDKTTKGDFRLGEALRPIPLPRTLKSGGLRYSCYEGPWDNLPDLERLTPLQSGIADAQFSVNRLGQTTPFACKLEGYFEAQKGGYYIFFLDTDTEAKLYLGGQLLMAIDIPHGKLGGQSFVVPLMRGFHTIRIEYFHKTGDKNLDLTYLPPAPDGDVLAHLPIAIPLELEYGSQPPNP
jgi:hypothetical protein